MATEKDPRPAPISRVLVADDMPTEEEIHRIGAAPASPSSASDKEDANADVVPVACPSPVPNSRSSSHENAHQLLPERLLWKLDRHLLIPMFFLNFLSLMGRTNIGAALIQHLPQDLHLDSTEVFLVLTMPAVPLVLCEVPSNLLMRWLDRKIKGFAYMRYLSGLNIMLGLVTLGQAFVQTYPQILGTRFLVGVFDAGLIPGCVFVTSLYYPGKHLQWRLSIIMIANISSNIAGNFLAYAIAQIQAPNGYHGWRWIFIVEGCLTAVAGLFSLFSSVSSPSTAHFLNPDEKALIARTVEAKTTKIGLAAEWAVFLRNPLNYAWAALYVFTCTTTYSVGVFSPTFVQSFHPNWSVPEVQAQVVPIFAVSSVVCLVTAILADRLDHRSGFALLGYVITIIGFTILRDDSTDTRDVTMMALYFIAIGTFISLPMIWTLTLLNLATPFQRAIGIGFVVGVGNVSGYISSWIFRTNQAPWYRYGMTVGLILTCVAAGLLLVSWAYMAMQNRRSESSGPADGEKKAAVVSKYRC